MTSTFDVILADNVEYDDAYIAAFREWIENDMKARNVSTLNEDTIKERTFTSLNLVDAVETLKSITSCRAPQSSFIDKASQQKWILIQMVLWIQVEVLREQVKASSEGQFRWKDFGIEQEQVAGYLEARKESWKRAKKKLEATVTEHREGTEADEWDVEKELRLYLSRRAHDFLLSTKHIEAYIPKVLDAYERPEATSAKGRLRAPGTTATVNSKTTANAILPIEKLNELMYEEIHKMLIEEINHKMLTNRQKRSFVEDVKYLEAIFTQFAWRFTLQKILAQKRGKGSVEKAFSHQATFHRDDKTLGIYWRCINRLKEKAKEQGIEEELKKAMVDAENKVKGKDSIHLSDTDLEDMNKYIAKRAEKNPVLTANLKVAGSGNKKRKAAETESGGNGNQRVKFAQI